MQQFQSFRISACKEYGTLVGLGYVFIGFPLKRFFRTIILMIVCETLGDKTLRVPTFYSPPLNETDTNIIDAAVYCMSTVFGAIHCIAWSFQFASLQERWTWRISAILISALPICLYALGELGAVFDNKANKTPWMNLYNTFIKFGVETVLWLYIIARMVLLILPLVALRALPPGVYVQLNWVSFIPHI